MIARRAWSISADWETRTTVGSPVFLVYSGLAQAGVIEFERASRDYRVTPVSWGLGVPVPGSFSIEVLKRQVTGWLESRAEAQ